MCYGYSCYDRGAVLAEAEHDETIIYTSIGEFEDFAFVSLI